MRWEVKVVKGLSVKIARPTSSTMHRADSSTSRNEKTRSRSRQPGLLVCRKEGLGDVGSKGDATNRRSEALIFRTSRRGAAFATVHFLRATDETMTVDASDSHPSRAKLTALTAHS
jgi:hypothetical protein